MVIGVILGLILGVIAAVRQNSWVDYTATVISVIAVSVPSFVLAVLLQYVFSVRLQWFPVAGWEGIDTCVTFIGSICSCFSNCNKIHKGGNDRSVKFGLHLAS